MNWTTALPSESGFYWYRYDLGSLPEVVEWEEDMLWMRYCGSELGETDPHGEFWPEKLKAPPH